MNIYSGPAMRRRDEIRRLLKEQPVRSQQELQALLRGRGVEATQPTISRDIRELGLVKGPAGYAAPEDLTPPSAIAPALSVSGRREEKLGRLVGEFVLSVEQSGSLVIVRTPPADAQPVARAIDEAAIEEVLGTIAGDDTIFLAARSAAAAGRMAQKLRRSIAPLPSTGGPARFPHRARHGKPARKRS